MIRITEQLSIAPEEITFAASRSGGPGGQNVNKVETRVTLRFDLAGSPSVSDEQRERLRSRLATRITKEGVLHVTAQKHRTQAANREAALLRFIELLQEALAEAKQRQPTRVSRAAKRRRVEAKRLRGERKRERAGRGEE